MKSAWIRVALFAVATLPALAADGPARSRPWDSCTGCHEQLVREFVGTPHAGGPAGCVGCHGPADDHVAAGGDASKIRRLAGLSGEQRSATCLACHERGRVAHWDGSAHDGRKLDCMSCHNPHPKGTVRAKLLKADQIDLCGSCHGEQRVKMHRSGHMPVREGKMSCTSCHNPHGTLTDGQLHQNSINDNCYSCHAEKRGPFLFEHDAVREDCISCHDPHGSIHNRMLKVKQGVLCQACHDIGQHPKTSQMAPSRVVFNRGCVNCHSQIHGSNHPAGEYFTR